MPDTVSGLNIAEQNNDFRQHVLMIASVLAVFYGLWFAYDNYCIGNYRYAVVDFIVAVIFTAGGTSAYLNKKLVWPRIISVITVSLFFFSIYLSGGIEGTGAFWSFLVPPIVFFLSGFRHGVVISSLYLICCLVTLFLRQYFPEYIFVYDTAFLKRFFGIFAFSSIVSGGYEYHKMKGEKVLLDLLSATETSWKKTADSELKYRTLFDGCGHGIVIADIEDEVILVLCHN